MPRGNGFTRRGLFGAGAAGAAAAGHERMRRRLLRARDRRTRKDAPNVVLIFTDSTRADYIGHYNASATAPAEDTPNLDALGRDSLAFKMAVPGGDAHRPGAARAAHRRALVPVPQLRAHAGPAGRPGLDPDPGPPADRDRGARARPASRPPTAPTTRSSSARASRTSAARSTSPARASRRAPTASSTSRSSARRRAARSSATCCPR